MPASVHKAALVLDLFSVERPDWGPTEVADELGIAKSTAHALLAELTSVGLTERLPCGRYRLGWRTLELARTKLATSGYRDAIAPTARRLASHFDETVHITAWERGRVLYVASQRPPDGVAAPAEPVAAQLTPPGTVMLAERAGGAGSELEPGELERTRRRGYAVGAQRALEGVDCAAAPVRTSDGPATAALALCAPRDRFQPRRDQYARAIAGAGDRVARSVRRYRTGVVVAAGRRHAQPMTTNNKTPARHVSGTTTGRDRELLSGNAAADAGPDPGNFDAVATRYAAAASGYGMQFLTE